MFQVWLKLTLWFWRKRSLISKTFCTIFSPKEKSVVHHFNKLESQSLKNVCLKFRWNWPIDTGEDDILMMSVNFHYYSFWKGLKYCRCGIKHYTINQSFIWTNLITHHLKSFTRNLVKIWLFKENKNVKSLQIDRWADEQTTDNRRS